MKSARPIQPTLFLSDMDGIYQVQDEIHAWDGRFFWTGDNRRPPFIDGIQWAGWCGYLAPLGAIERLKHTVTPEQWPHTWETHWRLLYRPPTGFDTPTHTPITLPPHQHPLTPGKLWWTPFNRLDPKGGPVLSGDCIVSPFDQDHPDFYLKYVGERILSHLWRWIVWRGESLEPAGILYPGLLEQRHAKPTPPHHHPPHQPGGGSDDPRRGQKKKRHDGGGVDAPSLFGPPRR